MSKTCQNVISGRQGLERAQGIQVKGLRQTKLCPTCNKNQDHTTHTFEEVSCRSAFIQTVSTLPRTALPYPTTCAPEHPS